MFVFTATIILAALTGAYLGNLSMRILCDLAPTAEFRLSTTCLTAVALIFLLGSIPLVLAPALAILSFNLWVTSSHSPEHSRSPFTLNFLFLAFTLTVALKQASDTNVILLADLLIIACTFLLANARELNAWIDARVNPSEEDIYKANIELKKIGALIGAVAAAAAALYLWKSTSAPATGGFEYALRYLLVAPAAALAPPLFTGILELGALICFGAGIICSRSFKDRLVEKTVNLLNNIR